jgi:diphosphomevalonate decarboxylase
MPDFTATAIACSNIAFIKYWGNRDQQLRLPANGSISMNLDGLYVRTQIAFDESLRDNDLLELNGQIEKESALRRVSQFLDHFRRLAGTQRHARVVSESNFPVGAGLASSAAAFAALAVAAAGALHLNLSEAELSRLARLGSGSACRSIPGGFVEWRAGERDADSYAFSIAPPDYWPLVDCIAVLETAHKPVGSTEGHLLADTSPLQPARVADAPRRLEICQNAIHQRDFEALADIIEQDSNLMHAVMMPSQPPLFYWEPESLALMKAVHAWRAEGIPAAYTLDAGPNVHVICEAGALPEVRQRLAGNPAVRQILVAHPGGPAHLIPDPPAG